MIEKFSRWKLGNFTIFHCRNTFGVCGLLFLLFLYIFWTSSEGVKLYEAVSDTETISICNVNLQDYRKFNQRISSWPMIYFVTPTYPRREQIAELTRLGQTLMHIPNLHWIVADDVDTCNNYLDFIIKDFGIPYTHISSPMPDIYRSKNTIPRGVANRRAALSWIRNNNIRSGVLYFGDDDNTFSLRLFTEIRSTKRVSMFPVGLIGKYGVSAPIVKNGRVVGFFDSWPAKRQWPVDMAGFAVNLEYLSHHPNATMPYKAGYEEDEFLKSINLTIDEIEPKANNCTEIFVWHTQTTKVKASVIKIDDNVIESDKTSLGPLLKHLNSMGISHPSSTSGVNAEIIKNGKMRPISTLF
ncbi:galactosylgalactosylxylosylprotein 3-beta-glucuronosyltransferase S [Lutzomyia longipalpis]|uniref:Galactosylgalactosylxylosylprotein 3-beta-glucuronosyltransferase n=1 Tax=Lutzomyia longipalpis TaxID=7200 RepID=A0A1B0C836_LUTLO|nr:galactosylgalactosylxylosylprotein 3-beta-glucuronosyltransferase S [Lutzomyia longipalpis]